MIKIAEKVCKVFSIKDRKLMMNSSTRDSNEKEERQCIMEDYEKTFLKKNQEDCSMDIMEEKRRRNNNRIIRRNIKKTR